MRITYRKTTFSERPMDLTLLWLAKTKRSETKKRWWKALKLRAAMSGSHVLWKSKSETDVKPFILEIAKIYFRKPVIKSDASQEHSAETDRRTMTSPFRTNLSKPQKKISQKFFPPKLQVLSPVEVALYVCRTIAAEIISCFCLEVNTQRRIKHDSSTNVRLSWT